MVKEVFRICINMTLDVSGQWQLRSVEIQIFTRLGGNPVIAWWLVK
jgi:hypothetical protein